MQAAFATAYEGAKLAVRIEPGNLRILPEYIPDCFDLLFSTLFHYKLATDTAHQNCKIWSLVAQPAEAGFGGGRRSVDEIVHIGLHQLRRSTLRDVAGERHRLFLLIDGQDGPDDTLASFCVGNQDWKEQGRAWQLLGV